MTSTSAILAALLISATTAACVSQSVAIEERLEINTGGGTTGPFFALSLSSSGELSVKRVSLPFADTEIGLTTDTATKQLTSAETHRLFSLARGATDFGQGCGLVGHGTSAQLRLESHNYDTKFECDGAPKWPIGPRTKALLTALNQHLPERFHVF